MALPSDNDPKLWLAILHEIDQAGGSMRPQDVYRQAMNVLAEVPASSGAYQLIVSAETAKRRFRAFARFADPPTPAGNTSGSP